MFLAARRSTRGVTERDCPDYSSVVRIHSYWAKPQFDPQQYVHELCDIRNESSLDGSRWSTGSATAAYTAARYTTSTHTDDSDPSAYLDEHRFRGIGLHRYTHRIN